MWWTGLVQLLPSWRLCCMPCPCQAELALGPSCKAVTFPQSCFLELPKHQRTLLPCEIVQQPARVFTVRRCRRWQLGTGCGPLRQGSLACECEPELLGVSLNLARHGMPTVLERLLALGRALFLQTCIAPKCCSIAPHPQCSDRGRGGAARPRNTRRSKVSHASLFPADGNGELGLPTS